MNSPKIMPMRINVSLWFGINGDFRYLLFTLLFLVGVCVSFFTSPVRSCEEPKYISRQALGRIAELGTIYDETTDTFSAVNLFRETIDDNNKILIRAKQAKGPYINIICNASLAETFQKLQVDTNTAVNILSGLVKVDGSARFIYKKIRSTNSAEVTGVLLYTFPTVVQDLENISEINEQLLIEDALHHRGTHVVTGITWGASVAVLLRKKIAETEGESLQDLNKILETELNVLKSLNSNSFSPSKNQKSNFSVTIFGDIRFPAQTQTLITHAEILELFRNVSRFTKNVNNGKGIPISYRLTPLRTIQAELQFQSEYETDVCQLTDSVSTNILQTFESLLILEAEINTLQNQVHLYSKQCLDLFNEITGIQNEFLQSKENYKIKVKDASICLKKGKCTNKSTYPQLKNSEFQNFKIKISKAKVGLEICKKLQNLRADYGAEMNFTTKSVTNLKEVAYILFFKYQWIQEDKQRWDENLFTFSKTLNHSCHKLLVVDCNFNYAEFECKSLKQTVIKQMINNTFTNFTDVNNEMQNLTMKEPINFKFISESMQIGQLYNAWTDEFLENSILQTNSSNQSFIQFSVKNPVESVSVAKKVNCLSFVDIFKAFDIEPELQFSLLSGQINFPQIVDLMSAASLNALCLVNTKVLSEKSVNFKQSKCSDFVDLHQLTQNSNATHFVAAIQYGFNSVFIVEPGNSMSMFTQDHRELISTFITRQIQAQNSSGTWNASNCEGITLRQIQVYVGKNNNLVDKESFETCSELENYLVNTWLPSQKSSQGAHINYVLYPISNLRKDLGILFPVPKHTSVVSTNEDPATYWRILDQVLLAIRQMVSFMEAFISCPLCATEADHAMRLEIIPKLAKLESFWSLEHFKQIFQNIKLNLKSSPQALKNIRENFVNDSIMASIVEYAGGKQFEGLIEERIFYESLKGSSFQYLRRINDNFGPKDIFRCLSETDVEIYLLHYKPSWRRAQAAEWVQYTQFFSGLSKEMKSNNEKLKLFVVNCEFGHKGCENVTTPIIHEYKNGDFRSFDCASTNEKIAQCLNKHGHDHTDIQKDAGNEKTNSDSVLSCECNKTVAEIIVDAKDVRILGCGGLVNLHREIGSVFLKYTFNEIPGKEHRCVWTLENNSAEDWSEATLRISLLCDNLGDSGNLLSFHERSTENMNSSSVLDLRTNVGNYSDGSNAVLQRFVSFSPKNVSPATEFILQVDVLEKAVDFESSVI